MNDYVNLEKGIVRELSCRLCLCNDIVKLKPLSVEEKRKLKKLFDISVRTDDNLPRAICHECTKQVGNIHAYTIKVEKTKKFLDFYKSKYQENKKEPQEDLGHPLIVQENKEQPLIASFTPEEIIPRKPSPKLQDKDINKSKPSKTPSIAPVKQIKKRKTDTKYMEAIPLEEFAKTENLDKTLLCTKNKYLEKKKSLVIPECLKQSYSIVLIDDRPKQGEALDKQISLFYKMECGICHERGFQYSTLMLHYKDRHGVPGYVSCCDQKFHYYYPKKIIEHMASHLQPNTSK